ncbi:hypothetical protein F4778DRAFT_380291 [Xylariomycetidae sp. FL2044]|nr:hypothetical protein F4778DRAFT_380291 [Xylariomycetidae sp. FL2044]
MAPHDHLSGVPQELKDMIVRLSDPASIMKLAQTNKAFYEAVMGDQVQIVLHLLQESTIDSKTLRIIATSYHAKHRNARLTPDNFASGDTEVDNSTDGLRNAIVKLCNDCLGAKRLNTAPPPNMLLLSEADNVLKTDEAIKYFSYTLACKALQRGPRVTKSRKMNPPARPSDAELDRFYQAMYIMQTVQEVFPFKISSHDDPTIHQAWRFFWIHFSPWTKHQVRCVNEMMADWVAEGLEKEAENNDDETFHTPSAQRLRQLVLLAGPARLLRFYRNNNLIGLYRQARSQFHNSKRSEAWYEGGEKLWLSRIKKDNQVIKNQYSPSIDHLLKRYQAEGDNTGPVDAWFHVLRASTISNRSWTIDAFKDPGTHDRDRFDCFNCATLFGYLMWDRQRLDNMWTKGLSMPTMEVMRSQDQSVIHSFDLDRHYCGKPSERENCTCPQ